MLDMPVSARAAAPAPAEPAADDPVHSPSHYRGDGLEAIDVIDDWVADPGAHLGTAIKYILRAGRKSSAPRTQCLAKALWYVTRARDQVRRGREIGAWRRSSYPRLDTRRVVVAFDLGEDLALAIVGINCVLSGPTFSDHWFGVAIDALTHGLAAVPDVAVPAAVPAGVSGVSVPGVSVPPPVGVI